MFISSNLRYLDLMKLKLHLLTFLNGRYKLRYTFLNILYMLVTNDKVGGFNGSTF